MAAVARRCSTRTGCTFQGWATSASGGVAYTNQQSVSNLTSTAGGTVNLYAVWKIDQHTLTLALDGGSISGGTSIKQNYNTTYAVPTPTKTGHTFAGWTHSGGGSLSGSTYTFGTSNGTLTASWTINQYTLTVNPNGGTWDSSTSSKTFTQNYGTTKTIANPTRTDYEKNFSIRFDDIDINMHVNNALYPLWAVETLEHSFRDEYLPSQIEISFKKEGHLGEDVNIITQVDDNKTLHSIKALNDNRELSAIRINWIKR